MKRKNSINQNFKIFQIEEWKIASKEDVYHFVTNVEHIKKEKSSSLVVRTKLTPLDIYCYLKARFGEPNGLQNFLKKDDSDNWIHWDYLVLCGANYIYICGTSREIHIVVYENLSDQDWHILIDNIKKDFDRVGKEKSKVLQSLEKWHIFPNKYVQISDICSVLHENILDHVNSFQPYKSYARKNEDRNEELEKMQSRMDKLYSNCVQLTLMTPIMAEAFINMIILVLCKKDIKKNQREFDTFIRSNIDIKLFDMFYKCEKFERRVDCQSTVFKTFKSIMDKRNHRIHGNINPMQEAVEDVYFDRKCPLYKKSGDHIGQLYETLENLHDPKSALLDYENTHLFLLEIVECLSPCVRDVIRHIMSDPYPGYDNNRLMVGKLFPNHVIVGVMQGMRYDDELDELEAQKL